MQFIRLLTCLTLFAASTTVFCQPAPDFTVTDSWGQTHRLYADYLDQGKTVLIKVFYAACPPCNAIAPYLEPLYQDWGGGNADVQFIELSIKQTDTDAMINAYKSNHSTTYPACGGQGGSVAAVATYKSGLYGQYLGTPTFVVIAPDGSVNYDVDGVGIQATIAALDAAIAATGAQGTTSVQNPDADFPIKLQSNLVSNELLFQVSTESRDFEIQINNLVGQNMLTQKFSAIQGDQVSMDISSLAAGPFICSISTGSSERMVSYLWVKL